MTSKYSKLIFFDKKIMKKFKLIFKNKFQDFERFFSNIPIIINQISNSKMTNVVLISVNLSCLLLKGIPNL
jgi:hypothetical protein